MDTITRQVIRLTLIYFGRLSYVIILGPFRFHDKRFHCGFQTIAVDRGGHRSKVPNDRSSSSTILVAKRDAIIERHQKSIGVSVNANVRSAIRMRCEWDDEALTVSQVSKRCGVEI